MTAHEGGIFKQGITVFSNAKIREFLVDNLGMNNSLIHDYVMECESETIS